MLGTKLRIPAPRRELVPDVAPRLVLVSAPAGFGKTTLLSEWLTADLEPATRVAWLSLDDADNDLRRFLTQLVAAVQSQQGCEPVAPHHRPGRARDVAVAEQGRRRLVLAVWAALGTALALALGGRIMDPVETEARAAAGAAV
jgi:hypothetical protein